jgi:hypothetical protein
MPQEITTMFRFLPAVVALGVFAALAPAATTTIEFTIDTGKQARKNEPVTVTLTLPKEFAKVHTVHLTTAKGAAVYALGQFTGPGLGAADKPPADGKVLRELHFIVPSLEANKPVTLTAVLNTDEPEAKVENKPYTGFHWTDTKGESQQLDFGSTPVLRYMYKALDNSSNEKREETFKVYHHLFDPAGKQLVTNGAGAKLYPHHHGIFYGFKDVTYDGNKKVDIWHCPKAYQAHEKFLATEEGPILGRHLVLVAWHGEGDDLFAREEREMTVYHVPGGTLLQFVSRLKTTGGPVKLDGDPQHSGFHFRAAMEVAEKTKGETLYIRPDGAGKPGETRNWDKDHTDHKNLPWDAMSFVLGGHRFTMAYLDHPDNPKEARYSERDYGRFGSYFVTEVAEAKPLTVRYRLWLQEGQMKVDEVAALDEEFVKPVEVTIKK